MLNSFPSNLMTDKNSKQPTTGNVSTAEIIKKSDEITTRWVSEELKPSVEVIKKETDKSPKKTPKQG